MYKTDHLDAYITDFVRCSRITCNPWRGTQFLALQRLTPHRFHLIEAANSVKKHVPEYNVF